MKVAIINDTRPTRHYGCLMVMTNLERLLQKHGVEVIWTWPVSQDWRKHKDKIEAMPEVDMILVNGEGTIHHAPRRWQAQALLEFAAFSHQTLKRPCYLINATLYANEDSCIAHLNDFDEIYVRDRASFETLTQQGVAARLVMDLTFAFEPSVPYQPESGRICVVDSVMQTDVPWLKKFKKHWQCPYRSMVVARPDNYSFWKRPRKTIVETVKWFFRDRNRSLDPAEFETFLSGCELVVTGRYHTVTMCLKNKIPFVALESNTPKISFLLKEVFGHTDRVMPSKSLLTLNPQDWASFSKEEAMAMDRFLHQARVDNAAMVETLLAKTKAMGAL
ncbi:MAG: polysaccharide pyruvyl transferase family protein [Hydrogenovibrio sp.]|uniref:polysaccharide pyruvyl transferase family protein n=1 Tax=Hydrogenovibrio sp. TaxID=2065821 RepID=UPI0028708E64|nr:polysaccharide pyruvyl transferase family protein [Hydrogenovibrio sp.]MDR9500083.1 polysaccharide pyruvyl transferase family protein [Hydrogenovibrio sp.]